MIDPTKLLLKPEEPCPCGSGRLVRECCQVGNKMFKKATLPRTSGDPTGFHNDRCYASVLGDCSPGLSREHWLSKSTLIELNGLGGLFVGGLQWQPEGEMQPLSPNALASKVLCERHNSALSPIDVAGTAFFKVLNDANRVLAGEVVPDLTKTILLNGHDLERWYLKFLIGAIRSGSNEVPGVRNDEWVPPVDWVEYLFGYRVNLRNGGLCLLNLEEQEPSTAQLRSNLVFNASHKVSGLQTRIANMVELALIYGRRQGKMLKGALYRPTGIAIAVGDEWIRIEICGEYPGDGLRTALEVEPVPPK
jgi:hypothetical protein